MTPQYDWNIVESGVKHHNPIPNPTTTMSGSVIEIGGGSIVRMNLENLIAV